MHREIPKTKKKISKSRLGQKQRLDPMYCSHCRRFLGLERITKGIVMLKCPNSKCKMWNTIDFDEP